MKALPAPPSVMIALTGYSEPEDRSARRTPASPPIPPSRWTRTSSAGSWVVSKLPVQNLADEAVEGDRVEPRVRRRDHRRVDHLASRQLLQHPLELRPRVGLVAPDRQVFALQRDAPRVAEAEHARDDPRVHQVALAAHLAVERRGPAQ